ncbi:MAG: NAD(P)-dependent oxidoreductase [Polyangiaceae bacterium]|nr:NAD(P)-dependent oxidoreductase [Polyangiaceae bacterium]
MSRVLVTGASGYLGRVLVSKLLAEGYSVTACGMSRADSPFPASVGYVRADLSDAVAAAELLRHWSWDAVVNLAGPVPSAYPQWSDSVDLVSAHVRIAANLRSWIPAGFAGRLVHTSSMTVYGTPSSITVEEDHPRRPMHPYGMAKALAEDTIASGRPIDTWILRFGGLFSTERRGGALFHFMRAAREGRTLEVAASTPTPWNILHVDDAATAIVRCLSSRATSPGPVNISYGEPIELVAIAKQIASRTGVMVERKGDADHPPLDLAIAKAKTLFDWPPVSLKDRLDDLWRAWA